MTTHTITIARHTAQVVGLMGVLVLGHLGQLRHGTAAAAPRPGVGGPCD